MQGLTIGDVAKRAEVAVDTVRFYERQGLIAEPPRTPAGYRKYPDEVVPRLRFIQRAKELGFSLREVGELLDLRVHPDRPNAEVRQHALAKIADIDAKMNDLARMRQSLLTLAATCCGDGTTSACPILDALATEPA